MERSARSSDISTSKRLEGGRPSSPTHSSSDTGTACSAFSSGMLTPIRSYTFMGRQGWASACAAVVANVAADGVAVSATRTRTCCRPTWLPFR
ncbi:hypothetical protein D3C78_1597840 [compost metagenome]